MGKFDAFSNLPRIPHDLREGGTNYQFLVEKIKDTFQDRRPSFLITAYSETRAVVEELEEKLSEAKLRVEAAAQLLVEAYEGEGITSLKVAGVGTVRIQLTPYSHVKDRETYQQWCLENNFLPQMQIPWSTTNSTVKERLLAGEEPPPGVDVFIKTQVFLTREK